MKIIYSVEILRFLTALSIVIFHYKVFFLPYNPLSLINFDDVKNELPFFYYLNLLYLKGSYGVLVFFAISGFVFAYVYLQQKNITGKSFFIYRFARLYPLHILTLLLISILQFISWNKFDTFLIVQENNDFYHLLLNILFISGWGFEKGYSFNAPIWSVSLELIIYFLFFILLVKLKKNYLITTILTLIFLTLLSKFKIGNIQILDCGRLFFSGVLLYLIYININAKKFFFFIFFIIFLYSFIGNFKIFLFCPSLIAILLVFENLIIKFKLGNLFSTLGNTTYAIYLMHTPYQLFILLIFYTFNISTEIFIKLYFFIFYIVFLIFISWLTFLFFEKPINYFIRKKFL